MRSILLSGAYSALHLPTSICMPCAFIPPSCSVLPYMGRALMPASFSRQQVCILAQRIRRTGGL